MIGPILISAVGLITATSTDTHASETKVASVEADLEITNDGSLEDLRSKVFAWTEEFIPSETSHA